MHPSQLQKDTRPRAICPVLSKQPSEKLSEEKNKIGKKETVSKIVPSIVSLYVITYFSYSIKSVVIFKLFLFEYSLSPESVDVVFDVPVLGYFISAVFQPLPQL